ncbi:hemicentin-2 [Platysternon megacephalum]|uniref:Hemicentin-2 n=1 Tax=Platysternon megacephalum TaxID=55544 RepID=A0A4D9DE57_9SAUR|nr:hemicentin-2 [Platysternon megacephalum]
MRGDGGGAPDAERGSAGHQGGAGGGRPRGDPGRGPAGEAGPGVPGHGSRFPRPVRSVPADAGGGPRRAGGPAPGGLRGPQLLVLHRLHPGADALSLGGRAVGPGLAAQGSWLREILDLLLPAGAGAGLCTVRHLLGRFSGTHPRCLNVSRVRNGPASIVFLVTYARRGSRPGEPAGDMEAALRSIAAHFHHRGAPAEGAVPGVPGAVPGHEPDPPGALPGAGLGDPGGAGAGGGGPGGHGAGGVVSMRPCLWEVGAGEVQAGEKLHTYFTRLEGALDARQLLEEIWGHPRCLNSRRRWEGRPGTQPGAFLYLAIFRGACVPGGP